MRSENTLEPNARPKRSTFLSQASTLSGPISLPILFGMCLTSLNVLANQTVSVISEVSGETLQKQVPLHEVSFWNSVLSAMFAGAFAFSLGLFSMGLLKKTPHAHFKGIFSVSSLLILLTNLICGFFTNIPLLFIARFFMGAGTGAACALGPVYYIALLGPKNGSKIATLQGLFINLGILFERRLSNSDFFSGNSRIFFFISGASLLALLMNIFWTKNLAGESPNNPGEIEIIRATESGVPAEKVSEDENAKFFIGVCLFMHIVQQLTGINPILSNVFILFTENIKDQTGPAKAFFDVSGALGTGISCFIMFFRVAWFKHMVLTSGLLACGSFLAMIQAGPVASCWGAAFYLFFFAVGLASLPWMLPSMILRGERNVAIAAGLGSLANSLFASVYSFFYIEAYRRVGNAVFGVFALFCLIEAVAGFFLVRRSDRLQRNEVRAALCAEGVPLKDLQAPEEKMS
ncbi:uncharacterized protein NEMAJ01_0799 [Nematocida major]|uniref:uncharacterized protein n=1 Tax=Nematocida major TaxID=1912982 RepID=UPI002007F603|nr:uncharacterized protein NEMAJ01_0799 [Nematocida major]KAH9385903.1 hypothetical protein NEMAJ01_0799 [Nematocida major]